MVCRASDPLHESLVVSLIDPFQLSTYADRRRSTVCTGSENLFRTFDETNPLMMTPILGLSSRLDYIVTAHCFAFPLGGVAFDGVFPKHFVELIGPAKHVRSHANLRVEISLMAAWVVRKVVNTIVEWDPIEVEEAVTYGLQCCAGIVWFKVPPTVFAAHAFVESDCHNVSQARADGG